MLEVILLGICALSLTLSIIYFLKMVSGLFNYTEER